MLLERWTFNGPSDGSGLAAVDRRHQRARRQRHRRRPGPLSEVDDDGVHLVRRDDLAPSRGPGGLDAARSARCGSWAIVEKPVDARSPSPPATLSRTRWRLCWRRNQTLSGLPTPRPHQIAVRSTRGLTRRSASTARDLARTAPRPRLRRRRAGGARRGSTVRCDGPARAGASGAPELLTDCGRLDPSLGSGRLAGARARSPRPEPWASMPPTSPSSTRAAARRAASCACSRSRRRSGIQRPDRARLQRRRRSALGAKQRRPASPPSLRPA